MQNTVLQPWSLGGLPLDLPTLPDKLRQAGYSTHAIGKWHLGYHMEEYTPTHRGFDTFYGNAIFMSGPLRDYIFIISRL